ISEGLQPLPRQILKIFPSRSINAVASPWEIVPFSGCTKIEKAWVSFSISGLFPVAKLQTSVSAFSLSAYAFNTCGVSHGSDEIVRNRVCLSESGAAAIASWRVVKLRDISGQKFGIGQRVKTKVRTNGCPRKISSVIVFPSLSTS